MLKQQDMTYSANILYYCLSNTHWKSVEYLANLMRMSVGRCQLILTQLVMAGMAVEDINGEMYKLCL
ncbi:hypothetical protein [Erwinia pyrifoliae]|uniref:Uncharacterized protein n=1 Tax=Erwinia pyrifoliae TaxID=79967 RepID=A0ABY5X3S1_ERWPY|nr:hypothetical protein [Erwinia pyrifoliae]MCT2385122.1 hypothetical protein [Erwinia pyrifoliae]MCU8585654.1 hypothetical protein [Erwinia pyrifoliae]UWS30812.1 hypothetical protein NYP81_04950 [Erwinia pyrifoliae]UWS31959.1 hypothetical protein NYP84_09730 [Erwinia pyrifoliae]